MYIIINSNTNILKINNTDTNKNQHKIKYKWKCSYTKIYNQTIRLVFQSTKMEQFLIYDHVFKLFIRFQQYKNLRTVHTYTTINIDVCISTKNNY